MRQPSIAILHFGAAQDEMLRAIREAWPAASTQPRWVTLDPEAALRDHGASAQLAGADAALVVLGPGRSDTLTARLLSHLDEILVPGVLIAHGSDDSLKRLQSGSILVLSDKDHPASASAMLAALAQRQGVVRSLERSLDHTQSFQGEAAAEINKLQEELLLAAKVQRDFLPKNLPMDERLEAAVLFRPAGFVSGDIYDVERLSERYVSFFLADAMGHGVPAALMTLFISCSIPRTTHSANASAPIQPAEALARLNHDLACSHAGPTRFVTAVCGLIDLETSTVTIACGGHPPPMLISPRAITPIDSGGMLLGVDSSFPYTQTSVRLAPDETLLIHSDGLDHVDTKSIPESADTLPIVTHDLDGPSTNQRTLQRLICARNAGQRAASLIDALSAKLDSQAGSLHLADDTTLLAFSLPQGRAAPTPVEQRTETAAL